MSRAIWLCVALSGVAAMGDEQSADKKGSKFASPQAVWDAYRHAYHEKRWKEVFRCATPQAQERFVGDIIFNAAMLARTPARNTAAELKVILKNYGLELEQIEAMAESNPDAKHVIDGLIRSVVEKEKLYDDAMSVLNRESQGGEKSKVKDRATLLGQLENVKITGDKAQGQYTRRLNDGDIFVISGVRQTEEELTVQFRRIGGRWYVHKGV